MNAKQRRETMRNKAGRLYGIEARTDLLKGVMFDGTSKPITIEMISNAIRLSARRAENSERTWRKYMAWMEQRLLAGAEA